jgi:hypothetical protein
MSELAGFTETDVAIIVPKDGFWAMSSTAEGEVVFRATGRAEAPVRIVTAKSILEVQPPAVPVDAVPVDAEAVTA